MTSTTDSASDDKFLIAYFFKDLGKRKLWEWLGHTRPRYLIGTFRTTHDKLRWAAMRTVMDQVRSNLQDGSACVTQSMAVMIDAKHLGLPWLLEQNPDALVTAWIVRLLVKQGAPMAVAYCFPKHPTLPPWFTVRIDTDGSLVAENLPANVRLGGNWEIIISTEKGQRVIPYDDPEWPIALFRREDPEP